MEAGRKMVGRASCCFGVRLLFQFEWQIQNEGGAVSGAVALRLEGAAHFFGCQCAAVQAKSVPSLSGGETVGEDASEIFRWDANAVVAKRNADSILMARDSDGQLLVAARGLVAGVFGVADEVDENLQN